MKSSPPSSSTEWRSKGEVNVLLRIQSDDERRNVDNLFADANVPLSDEDSGVVDGFSEA